MEKSIDGEIINVTNFVLRNIGQPMGTEDDNERSGICNLGLGRLPLVETLELFRTAGRQGNLDKRRMPRKSRESLGAQTGVMFHDTRRWERP